ncbi:MAG: hypothetical protein J0I12_04560 [Candidatus Eremiobacteraeota bacterium]|nr:hypothetical protein [Candidatus Eremiobacteraeota bacterium]
MKTIYSLTQRWSPFAGDDEEGKPGRPHLQVLINETTGERLVSNMTEQPVHVTNLASWLAGQIPPDPCELWLDKPEWVYVFQLLYPEHEVKFEAQPPHLHRYFQEIEEKTEQHKTSDDYCLVRLFGEEAALRFYRSAWEYMKKLPTISPCLTLDFRKGLRSRYEVSFDPQGEPGFILKDEDGNFCLGLGYDTPAFVDHADLELLESASIHFFAEEYPWMLIRSPEGLTRETLDDAVWLLENLAESVRKGSAVRSLGRRLQRRGQAPLGRKALTKSGSVSKRAPSIRSIQ